MLVTALATPFCNGKTDALSYERLVKSVSEYSDALLAVGTTAEALLLNDCEKKLLVKLAKGIAPQLPLFVGVESPCTRVAVEQAQRAAEWGASGLLVAPPAFVKCTSDGFVQHIETIARESGLPVMLYNAPSRCGYTPDVSAWERTLNCATYIKDAGDDMNFTRRFADKTTVLCGNETLLNRALKNGAKGVVSVVANVAPKLTKRVSDGTADDDQKTLFVKLATLSMQEVNPIAVKYMLYKKGVFAHFDVRLPLTAASERTRALIDKLNWEEIA